MENENNLDNIAEQEKKPAELPTHAEITKVIEAIPTKKIKVALKIQYELSLMPCEIFRLRWIDVDFNSWLNNRNDYGTLNINWTSKPSKSRTLYLSPELMNLLYECRGEAIKHYGSLGSLIFEFGMRKGGFIKYMDRKEYSK